MRIFSPCGGRFYNACEEINKKNHNFLVGNYVINKIDIREHRRVVGALFSTPNTNDLLVVVKRLVSLTN